MRALFSEGSTGVRKLEGGGNPISGRAVVCRSHAWDLLKARILSPIPAF